MSFRQASGFYVCLKLACSHSPQQALWPCVVDQMYLSPIPVPFSWLPSLCQMLFNIGHQQMTSLKGPQLTISETQAPQSWDLLGLFRTQGLLIPSFYPWAPLNPESRLSF